MHVSEPSDIDVLDSLFDAESHLQLWAAEVDALDAKQIVAPELIACLRGQIAAHAAILRAALRDYMETDDGE